MWLSQVKKGWIKQGSVGKVCVQRTRLQLECDMKVKIQHDEWMSAGLMCCVSDKLIVEQLIVKSPWLDVSLGIWQRGTRWWQLRMNLVLSRKVKVSQGTRVRNTLVQHRWRWEKQHPPFVTVKSSRAFSMWYTVDKVKTSSGAGADEHFLFILLLSLDTMNVQVENSMVPTLRHTGVYLVLSTLKRFLFCTQGSLLLSVTVRVFN